MFYSNFVPKTLFWLQKCCDLENRISGPSRSLEMSPFDGAHATSYWCSIVTMALPSVVSEIFNVEKCCDLKIRVRGHSRSLKVIPCHRPCMVSYYCSIVTLSLRQLAYHIKCHSFWDIFRVVNIQWPWKPGLGHSNRNQHVSIRRLWLPINVT